MPSRVVPISGSLLEGCFRWSFRSSDDLGLPGFSQGIASEFDTIGVVNDAVENGVGQCRVADDVVPFVDRELAGYEHGAGVVAVFDDLEQVALLLAGQGLRSPIVEDE